MTEEEAIRLLSLAATIIQAHVRGYLVRKKFDFCQYRRRKYAAASIQAVWYKNSLISFWSIILNCFPSSFPLLSFLFLRFFPFTFHYLLFSSFYLQILSSLRSILAFHFPSHLIPFLSFSSPCLPFFHIPPLPFPLALFLPITSFSFLICSLHSKLPLTVNWL